MFGCPVEYFDQPQPVYEPFGLMPQGMAQFGILEHMNGTDTVEGDKFAQTWTSGPEGSDYGRTVHLGPGEYPPPPPPDYDPTLGPPTIYTGGGIGPIPPPQIQPGTEVRRRLIPKPEPPPPPPDPDTVRQTLQHPPEPPPPPPPERKWLSKPLQPSNQPQQLWKPDRPKRPYPERLQKPWKPPTRPPPQRLQKRNTGPNYR